MKKTVLTILLCFITLTISANAQTGFGSSRRLSEAADRLVAQTGDLSDRIYSDFRNRAGGASRSELDTVFLAGQLDSSARLFQQMVRDNRRDSDLRDAAAILSDLSRRAPAFGAGSNLWRDAQSTIRTIQRETGGGGNYGDGDTGNNGGDGNNAPLPPPSRPVSGRVTWRGTVDNEVQLFIKGNSVETRTIAGTTYNNQNFNFTTALPSRRVTVEVNKKRGRGRVNVLQQPSRNNDFTTVIQIIDKDGGAKEYEVEVYWY